MQHFHIASRSDVRDIERLDYDAVVPWKSVFEAIEDSASRHPSRTALTYLRRAEPPFDPERYDYRAFADQVRRAANLFRALGVDETSSVAFLLPSIPAAYFTLFGGSLAGRVCPINYLLGARHIAELIEAANASVLVALGPHPDLDIWSKVEEVRPLCPGLEHVLAVGSSPRGDAESFEKALARQRGDELDFERQPARDATAAFFHTGGTTGTPKLAIHTHGNEIHAAWGAAQMYDMRAADVIVNGFPLFHVAGSFVYGLSALIAGAEIVLPTMLGMRNPTLVRNYWRLVETFGATMLAGVPTVISSLLATPRATEDLRSIRCMLTGGSPLPTELAKLFEERFGLPVRNILGMTESSGVISIVPFHGTRRPGSCGLPLPFTEVKVVAAGERPARTEALPAGQTGVVAIRGPHLSPGYSDARRNAGTFDEGWLISGDLGHMSADGEVFITGRAKDIIIRGAHNIDPGEIENALMQHPAVQVAAAVGEPDEYAGELPVAFVALKPGAAAEEGDLIEFVKPLLPERPAWPKRVTVIEAIPMTAVGKIYKPALRVQSIERVVRERFAAAGSDVACAIACEDAGGGHRVCFRFCAAADRAVAERVAKATIGTLAIEHRVVFDG